MPCHFTGSLKAHSVAVHLNVVATIGQPVCRREWFDSSMARVCTETGRVRTNLMSKTCRCQRRLAWTDADLEVVVDLARAFRPQAAMDTTIVRAHRDGTDGRLPCTMAWFFGRLGRGNSHMPGAPWPASTSATSGTRESWCCVSCAQRHWFRSEIDFMWLFHSVSLRQCTHHSCSMALAMNNHTPEDPPSHLTQRLRRVIPQLRHAIGVLPMTTNGAQSAMQEKICSIISPSQNWCGLHSLAREDEARCLDRTWGRRSSLKKKHEGLPRKHNSPVRNSPMGASARQRPTHDHCRHGSPCFVMCGTKTCDF